MLGWLWGLLVGTFCNHGPWITEHSSTVVDPTDQLAIGVVKHLRCSKCGDWKKRYLGN